MYCRRHLLRDRLRQSYLGLAALPGRNDAPAGGDIGAEAGGLRIAV